MSEAKIVSIAAAKSEAVDWNAVEEAILRRRSIRKYKRAQVPAHLVRRMLEMGRYAPSQGNCQPWKFVVVRDAEMIRGMEAFCVEECKKLSRGFDYASYPAGTFRHFVTRAKAKQYSVTSVQGSPIEIDVRKGVKVSNANVVTADVGASNGLIHVIDSVILPPAKKKHH